MHLVAAWRERAGATPSRDIVLTVDHQLREGSRDEALAVREQAERLGFRHATLVWEGEKPAQGVSAAARDARYALIAGRCRSLSLTHVLLAHTLDDQAETVLMRLARGSGLDGLSAMAPISELHGLVLVRPLLDVSREDLRAFLQARNVVWHDDPTNADENYERVRIRKVLSDLEALGFTREALATSAARLQRVRSTLNVLAEKAMAEHVSVHEAGFCIVSRALFHEETEALVARVIGRCLMAVGGLEYPPKPEAVEALCLDFKQEDPAARTLGGCHVSIRGDAVLVVREAGRIASEGVPVVAGERIIWDGRFEVGYDAAAADAAAPGPICVGPLRSRGWDVVKQHGHTCHRQLREGLVCFWNADVPVAVPHLGYRDPKLRSELRFSAEFCNYRLLTGATRSGKDDLPV